MNKKEIALLLALNKTNYPDSQYRNMTQLELSALIDNWYHHFKEFPAETVNAIFYECQKTSHFPIQIADIYDKLKLIKKVNSKSIEQLWQEFLVAIDYVHERVQSYFGTFKPEGWDITTGQAEKRLAKHYFNNLDPELKEYIGSLNRLEDFGTMDRNTLEQVIFPAFRRAIEAMRQRKEVTETVSSGLIWQAGKIMIGEGE